MALEGLFCGGLLACSPVKPSVFTRKGLINAYRFTHDIEAIAVANHGLWKICCISRAKVAPCERLFWPFTFADVQKLTQS
jgi:hypothetical protein